MKIAKKEIIQFSLLGASCILIVFGILTMLSAGEMVIVFKGIANIQHVLVRYIIVIAMMAGGIMTFSNVAMAFENKKLRNGLTIGITSFATVMTFPLVYVFIAYFPGMNGSYGPLGEIMVRDIVDSARNILVSNASMIIFGIFGIIMAIVFLIFPLFTGVLAVKGKTIKISVGVDDLPVVKRQNEANEK
jgi:hypothetical protein